MRQNIIVYLINVIELRSTCSLENQKSEKNACEARTIFFSESKKKMARMRSLVTVTTVLATIGIMASLTIGQEFEFPILGTEGNNCGDRSIGSETCQPFRTNGPTNRQTDRPGHEEVSLPISAPKGVKQV